MAVLAPGEDGLELLRREGEAAEVQDLDAGRVPQEVFESESAGELEAVPVEALLGGDVDRDERLVFLEAAEEGLEPGAADVVAREVEVHDGVVGSEALADQLGACVGDEVFLEFQAAEVRVVEQDLREDAGALEPEPAVAQVQLAVAALSLELFDEDHGLLRLVVDSVIEALALEKVEHLINWDRVHKIRLVDEVLDLLGGDAAEELEVGLSNMDIGRCWAAVGARLRAQVEEGLH